MIGALQHTFEGCGVFKVWTGTTRCAYVWILQRVFWCAICDTVLGIGKGVVIALLDAKSGKVVFKQTIGTGCYTDPAFFPLVLIGLVVAFFYTLVGVVLSVQRRRTRADADADLSCRVLVKGIIARRLAVVVQSVEEKILSATGNASLVVDVLVKCNRPIVGASGRTQTSCWVRKISIRTHINTHFVIGVSKSTVTNAHA